MSSNVDLLRQDKLCSSLIRFSLPIVGSGVVQQSFNSIDIAVVGRLVGANALAAVGANGPVISLIVTLFMGLALGANVLIARALGRKDPETVKRGVATQALVALIGGIGLLIIGLAIASPLLSALDTPADVLDDATLYLCIYALSFPAMTAYNFVSAVLRCIGDTRRPFLWLVAGGIVNIVLNLIFVLVFSMGVEGVAIATTVSSYISAIGVTVVLMREKGPVHLSLRHMHIYKREFGAMFRIGIPAGLQGTMFSLSNVIIQGAVNQFGAEVMAGNAAAITYEIYGYLLVTAFVQASVAFISVNYGAGNYKQCRRIMWRCMALSSGGCLILNTIIIIIGAPSISIMTSSYQAITYGLERLHIVLLIQFIACSYEVAGGAIRALGYSVTPMLIALFGTCALRVWWVKATDAVSTYGDLLLIYPITWAVTGILMLTAYWFVQRRVLRGRPVPLVDQTL